jgi:hypothetical protein
MVHVSQIHSCDAVAGRLTSLILPQAAHSQRTGPPPTA